MKIDDAARASLADKLIRPFRDKTNGGAADHGDDAWWIEDMLDRIERAINPYLSPPLQDDPTMEQHPNRGADKSNNVLSTSNETDESLQLSKQATAC
jgi:hypothetical protein